MKKLFYFILFILFIGWTPKAFATLYGTGGWLPPMPNCIKEKSKNAQIVDFWNWYHGGITRRERTRFARTGHLSICSMYMVSGAWEYIRLTKMIPVYSLDSGNILWFYNIYWWQDFSMDALNAPKYYTGAFFGSTFVYAKSFSVGELIFWFSGGNFSVEDPREAHNEAYIKSLEEPFVSAPTIQMYAYLGSPLLVARSSTGLVTDVFFQRKNVENPTQIAQQYLWDKWYHP